MIVVSIVEIKFIVLGCDIGMSTNEQRRRWTSQEMWMLI